MIRNNNQMKLATSRRDMLEQKLIEYRSNYSGIEAEIMTSALKLELKQIREDVIEYGLLHLMSLEDAVEGPLQKPMLLDQISDILTKLRLASGFTQTELASELGWEQSNVSRFENENYGSHTVSKVVEYASALGIWLKVIPSLTDELETFAFRKDKDIAPTTVDFISTQESTSQPKSTWPERTTHSGTIANVYRVQEATI